MSDPVISIFLRKELRDIRANPQLLPGYFLLPGIAVIVPLIFLALVPLVPVANADFTSLVELTSRDPQLAGYAPPERLARLIVREVGAFFLLMPVLLSAMNAAMSIASEKQQRTLEPLLATPMTDRSLLLAKLIASLGPAVAITWLAVLLSVLGTAALTAYKFGTVILPGTAFFLAVLFLAPLCGAAAALMGMRASMRSADVQTAVQVASLWVVPAGILIIAMLGRPALRSVPLGVGAIAFAALLTWWFFRGNLKRFEREEILTRWK